MTGPTRHAARTGPTPAGWAEPLDGWAAHLTDAGRTPATVAGYLRHLRALALDLSPIAPTPGQVTPAALGAWLAGHHWSAHTRARALVSLRGFYGWAVTTGRVRRSPLLGLPPPPPNRPTGPPAAPLPAAWVGPLDAWTEHLRAGARTPDTITTRLGWLRRLALHLPDPWAVTSADLAAYLARPELAAETKRSVRASLRGFYGWAVTAGHLSEDPAAALPSVRLRRTIPRPAPDPAIRAALDRCDDRTALALLLATYAGLRRAEIAALHTADIGTEHLRVTGKGGHERLVPLHPDLAAALAAELHRRTTGHPGTGWPTPPPAHGWLFPGQHDGHLSPRWLGRLVSRALPAGLTTHTLRHRFATAAYAAQRDLRAVQELLGHASPATTARYAAVPGGALRAAVLGAGLYPLTIDPGHADSETLTRTRP